VFPVALKNLRRYYYAHQPVNKWVIFSETGLNKRKVKVKWR
jgi:hypothetical protein